MTTTVPNDRDTGESRHDLARRVGVFGQQQPPSPVVAGRWPGAERPPTGGTQEWGAGPAAGRPPQGGPGQGLVICAKSVRAPQPGTLDGDLAALHAGARIPDAVAQLLEDAWKPRFPTAEALTSAIAAFDPVEPWDGHEGPRWKIRVGPGAVTVSSTDPARKDRAMEREIERRMKDVDADAAHIERTGEHLPEPDPQRCISEWSRKSRANMVKRFAEVDYRPMFEDAPGCPPAMLTLTYPGDWLTVAPNGKACKKQLRNFAKRFYRAWGRPLRCIWKLEFQDRGAPHFHLFCVPPITKDADGRPFRQWLSETWADVVGHPDAEERRKHIAAGTGIDYAEGMRCQDPRRLVAYFAGHSRAKAKEYQHIVPEEWREPGKGPGRFWGYMNLELMVAEAEVTPDQAIQAGRTVRRWAKAQGTTRQVTVTRTDTSTGQTRRRKVRRPVRRMTGGYGRGYVTVNDGPAFLEQLTRAIELTSTDPLPRKRGRDPEPENVPPVPHTCSVCGDPLAAELARLGRHVGRCHPPRRGVADRQLYLSTSVSTEKFAQVIRFAW